VLRLCILNHSTTRAEVDRALELAEMLTVGAEGGPSRPRESYPSIEAGWLGRPELDADGLRSVPLFAELDESQAARVLAGSYEHHAEPGEAVVEQWQISRDLYVVLDGAVEVTDDGQVAADLGPGDFFGELAAIDWGAGFARTRTRR
jgi:hypothetical protein